MSAEWMINPPLDFSDVDDTLRALAVQGSDFWRKTHYGFIRHNGHFYAQPVSGDFTMQVTFTGNYRNEYDQAGLMLWVDEQTWLKTGVEYTEGRYFASAVVTRDFSNWGIAPLSEGFKGVSFTIRLKRQGGSIEIHYRLTEESPWVLLALAYLSETTTLHAGRMLCAPSGAGFEAAFTDFSITPARADQ